MDRGVTTLEARISEAANGWRLDRALADAVPALSRERLKALISSGAVSGPDGLARDPARKALAGSLFTVAVPDPTPAHNEAQDIALDVVFEDEHLIVIDKPAGLVVHPAAGNLDGTLVNALLHHCAGQLSGIGGVARPGIVHRIDKDTSGLMVAAKSDRAHVGLAAQFKAHSIDRRYRAIVAGRVSTSAGTICFRWAIVHESQENGSRPRRFAESMRSRIGVNFGNFATQPWSNAGSKPAGRIRSASTWLRSVIRCWAIRSMGAPAPSIVHFWQP
jgi:RluA family pseudouridine synthase